MTPAETAAWDAEIDARRDVLMGALRKVSEVAAKFAAGRPRHARPYSRLRERDIFDEAHTPRHAKRSHRAEVAA